MRRNVCIIDIGIVELTALIVLILLFLAPSGFLVAGERVIAEGIVNTTKDNNGNIIAIDLKVVGGDAFNIILDERGKVLGNQMDGKLVEVIGDVSGEGDDIWLEVISYKVVSDDGEVFFKPFVESS